TRWKRRGAKGSCSASASSKRTDRPRAAALRRASSIIAEAKSTPTTWCPRAASSRARKPVPQPTSSASTPGRPSRTRSKMRSQAARSPGVRMLWPKSSSKLGARRPQWVATCCLTGSVASKVMRVDRPSASCGSIPIASRFSASARGHEQREHARERRDRDVSGRHLYDEIGGTYGAYRRPDPRIAAAIVRALGDAESVVNVGAGTGSCEPTDRRVVAVEPAPAMIRQRGPDTAPVVQASATALPFPAAAFAASLAVLTIHHWPDRWEGLAELKRVARHRVVLLTWDPAWPGFWLTDEYFPGLMAIDRQIFPTIKELQRALGRIEIHPLPVPHDCTDGFLGAYWRRPHAYLDPGVRSALSSFTKLGSALEPGPARLRRDLDDAVWQLRHAPLLAEPTLDLGYRLVIASRP